MADSDPIRTQMNHLFSLQSQGHTQEALSGIEEMLRDAANLPEDVQAQLRRWQRLWTTAVSPDYAPPAYPHIDDYTPLYHRARAHLNAGRYSESLRDAWTLLQYASYGTMIFQIALGTATDAAIRCGRYEIARPLAHTLLPHSALMQAAQHVPETPLHIAANYPEDEQVAQKSLRFIDHSLPLHGALQALADDPAPIWAELLETILASKERAKMVSEHMRQHIVQALSRHYLEQGNQANLEQLRRNYPAYFPEHS